MDLLDMEGGESVLSGFSHSDDVAESAESDVASLVHLLVGNGDQLTISLFQQGRLLNL
jgi:hypothetical protein